jgi:hypothetical protein
MKYHIYGAGHEYRFETEMTAFYAEMHMEFFDLVYDPDKNDWFEKTCIPFDFSDYFSICVSTFGITLCVGNDAQKLIEKIKEAGIEVKQTR